MQRGGSCSSNEETLKRLNVRKSSEVQKESDVTICTVSTVACWRIVKVCMEGVEIANKRATNAQSYEAEVNGTFETFTVCKWDATT